MKRMHDILSMDSTHLASKALDLLAPLVLTRTLGFTDRPKPMPHPYGSARIPNAFPSLDRVSIELFPRLNSLRSGWDTEVIPARTLCICFIATQLDFMYTRRLFGNHFDLLQRFDVDSMCSLFAKWYADGLMKGARKFFRGRFQTVDLPTLCRLLKAWESVSVPSLGMRDFATWLRTYDGIGPLHSMVIARELRLYDFFPSDESIPLGKGQGSFKFLTEVGVPPDHMEGVIRCIQSHFQEKMELECKSRGVEANASVRAILLRKPTYIEVENMLCEMRKMLRVKEGKRAKKFYGGNNEIPSTKVPMPLVDEAGRVAVKVVDLGDMGA